MARSLELLDRIYAQVQKMHDNGEPLYQLKTFLRELRADVEAETCDCGGCAPRTFQYQIGAPLNSVTGTATTNMIFKTVPVRLGFNTTAVIGDCGPEAVISPLDQVKPFKSDIMTKPAKKRRARKPRKNKEA